MARPVCHVLEEILQAITGIEDALAGKSFADFEASWLLRHGVQRGVEIISEGCRHLPDDLTTRHPAIPWQRIRASRNVLRHEYFRIADDVIWAVVIVEPPRLKRVILDEQRSLDVANEGRRPS